MEIDSIEVVKFNNGGFGFGYIVINDKETNSRIGPILFV